MTAPKSLDSRVVSALRLLFWGVTNMDTMVSSLVASSQVGHTSGSLHHARSPHTENPLPHLASKSRKRSVYTCHQLWALRYLRVCRLLLASMCSLPSNPSFLQNVVDNFYTAWVWLPLMMFQQNKFSGHSLQGRMPPINRRNLSERFDWKALFEVLPANYPLSTTLHFSKQPGWETEPPKLFQQNTRTSSKAPNLWFRSGGGCT